MHGSFRAKCPSFLSDFNKNLLFFSKNFRKISNFIIIRPVQQSFTCGRTDIHEEVKSRFCNFAKVPKNGAF